jgi:hypothetical protein
MILLNKTVSNRINNLDLSKNKIHKIVMIKKINLIKMMIKMMIVKNNRHNKSWRLRIML